MGGAKDEGFANVHNNTEENGLNADTASHNCELPYLVNAIPVGEMPAKQDVNSPLSFHPSLPLLSECSPAEKTAREKSEIIHRREVFFA